MRMALPYLRVHRLQLCYQTLDLSHLKIALPQAHTNLPACIRVIRTHLAQTHQDQKKTAELSRRVSYWKKINQTYHRRNYCILRNNLKSSLVTRA